MSEITLQIDPLEPDPPLPIVKDKIAEAIDRARALAAGNRAHATEIAYKADLGRFVCWCLEVREEFLPVRPQILAAYLSELEAQGNKPATIRRALSAIRQAHKKANLGDPADPFVKSVLNGIERAKTIGPLKADALTFEKLCRVLEFIPADFIGIRDKAILLLGFFCALRRSELVALKTSDLTEAPEGLIVHLKKSKTDQTGRGRSIPLPFLADQNICPVRALRRWQTIAGINDGFLFRHVGPGGRSLVYQPSADPLNGRTISLIVKRHAAAAGYFGRYSGHSLRAGFITSAANAGSADRHIQAITGHRSIETMAGYIRDGTLFKNTPAYLITDSPICTCPPDLEIGPSFAFRRSEPEPETMPEPIPIDRALHLDR